MVNLGIFLAALAALGLAHLLHRLGLLPDITIMGSDG